MSLREQWLRSARPGSHAGLTSQHALPVGPPGQSTERGNGRKARRLSRANCGSAPALLRCLQFVAKDLAKLFDLRPDHELAVALVSVLVEVILVVVLGLVENRERNDLGNDRAAKSPRGIELFFVALCQTLLFVAVIKNRRTILRPDVVPLAIERRRVVRFPENFKKLRERKLHPGHR